jgi:hypothetical protein
MGSKYTEKSASSTSFLSPSPPPFPPTLLPPPTPPASSAPPRPASLHLSLLRPPALLVPPPPLFPPFSFLTTFLPPSFLPPSFQWKAGLWYRRTGPGLAGPVPYRLYRSGPGRTGLGPDRIGRCRYWQYRAVPVWARKCAMPPAGPARLVWTPDSPPHRQWPTEAEQPRTRGAGGCLRLGQSSIGERGLSGRCCARAPHRSAHFYGGWRRVGSPADGVPRAVPQQRGPHTVRALGLFTRPTGLGPPGARAGAAPPPYQ